MATIVLAVAGQAAGTGLFGAFLGAVGAAVGGYIDQTLLFPPPDQEGPRYGSQGIQGAAEGEPKVLVYGQDAIRTQGAVIHVSDIIEEASTTSTGGCFGGGSDITSYRYFVHVAIGICEAGTETRPAIESIDKIRANGRLIYESSPDINLTASDLTLTVRYEVYAYPYSGETDKYNVKVWMDISAPWGGTDLLQFKSGYDVTMSGWSSSDNNGTWQCVGTESLGASGTQMSLYWGSSGWMTIASFPPTWPANFPDDEAAGASVTLDQDLPEVAPGIADSITFYEGDQATADPVLESFEGSGNVPTYAGTAIAVIEKLSLDPWGNRLPNLEFELQPDATRTVGSTLAVLAERAGINRQEELDVTAVTDSLRGFKLRGVSKMDKAMLSLLLLSDLETQEDRGVITFSPATSLTEV
ncbi:MAG: hypothetical protein GY856_36690, partial [bacterium]|nr:hypothetical protein [bacterium]